MSRARLATLLLLPCVALFAFLALPWPHGEARAEAGAAATAGATTAAEGGAAEPARAAPQPDPAQPVLGPMALDVARNRYVASAGSARAVLSVSPRLQQGLEKLLAQNRVPVGAVVLIEPRTGRVLAMAEHRERPEPGEGSAALRPVAPAASIFKIVTSAALLDRGITPDSEVCFHGGKHRIQPALLSDNPRRDRRCLTLSAALGKSANVVFAKLAGRELTPDALRSEAARFLFDRPIPFSWPIEPSTARIADEPFELATTAAGFGPVRLSPLHGALIAAIVANGGRYVPPRVVDELDGAASPPSDGRQVIRPEVAAALARMMETTVTEGTARKVFRRDQLRRGSPLRTVTVAGKTGSLAESDPYRDNSWFVGFAPVEDPQVAVAAVVVNQRMWRVRASAVAVEALKAYFGEERRPVRTAAR